MHSPLSTKFVVATFHRHNSNQKKKKKKEKKNGSLRRRPRRNKSILFSVVRSPSVALSRHFFKISPPCSD
jgi:hypothetical protein